MNLRTTNLHTTRTRRRRTAGTLGVACVLLALVSACGSSEPVSADDPEPVLRSMGTGEGRGPGTIGRIAAVEGDLLQVQNEMTGQVAVTVTDRTTITEQLAASYDEVAVGSCVVVRGAEEAEAEAPGEVPGTLTAADVAVSDPEDGECSPDVPGEPGTRSDRPEGAPSDVPEGVPSDVPDGRAAMGFRGEVTAVTADGFTMEAGGPGSSSGEAISVTVTDETAYSVEAVAARSALEVGRCVTATGETDDVGGVTADSISVSDAEDGSCNLGALRAGPGAGEGS